MSIEDFELLKASKLESLEDFNFPLEKKNKIIKARLKQNPQDINGWLEFINLQDELVADLDFGVRDSSVKLRAAAEKKLEILKTALQQNASSVELRLEKVKIMEHLYGPNEQQVDNEWKSLENRHLNSLKMWKGNIIMHMNDRSLFRLDSLLTLNDRCIYRLQSLISGNIRSHPKEQGSEDFLVDLIFLRCKLLSETGHLPITIAILQALTEFNVFAPDSKELNVMKQYFEQFWASGVRRIGDEKAIGWKHSPIFRISSEEYEKEMQQEFNEDYDGYLGAQLKRLEEVESKELDKCRNEGFSHPHVWSIVERCRDKFTWRPLRYPHQRLIREYSWYKAEFIRDIEPVLVKFSSEKEFEKTISRILKLLGCIIPGESKLTQEDILSEFGVFSKSTCQYEGMYQFLDRFLELLTQSDSMSLEFIAKFIIARLLTFQKQVYENYPDKIQGKKVIQKFAQELLSKYPDFQFLISYYAAESLKLFDSNSAKKTYEKMLKIINTDIWKISNDIKRLSYLRVAVDLCRLYPYHHESDNYNHSKRLFLKILGAFGYLEEEFDQKECNIDVKTSWLERIKNLKDNVPNTKFLWIGDEYALTLELASLYFYESRSKPNEKIQEFENLLKFAASSGLTNESIMDFRIRVNFDHFTYKHFKNDGFSIYRDIVNTAIDLFPTNVQFLKAYIDSNKYQTARIFLRQEYKDETQKLVRHCGLYYLEKRAHKIFSMESSSKNVDHIRHTLEYIAQENCGSLIPDCTLWRVLLDLEKQHGTSKQIDNTFFTAFKQCPWSKNLLLDMSEKQLNISGFLTDIENYAKISGFRLLCYTAEIELLLLPNA